MNGTNKVSVSIISNKKEAAVGEDIYVLVKLKMLNGWHTYWENPGDAGERTNISWILPKGYSAETVKSSVPITFFTDGVAQYGYSDSAYYLIRLKADRVIPYFTKYKFEADISWLACREECVPEKVKINFSIPVASIKGANTEEWEKELFHASRTFPLKPRWTGHYKVTEDNMLLLNIDSGYTELPKIYKNTKFIPHQENIIVNNESQIIGYDGKNKLSLLIPLENKTIENLSGILILGDKNYELNFSGDERISAFNKLSPFVPIKKSSNSLIWILFLALTGGIILNLMPCILPILTLKAISLIQSAHNRRESRIEAIMYFIGVVASFLSIATILIMLKINGEKIGWGFQMQYPAFLITMIVVFFIIFLMLLDIIKLRNPFNSVGRVSFKHKRINSFFTGLFSVLIASPCTAPFMGIAIGYTISQPLRIFYPVFLALSIGYALPFTLIGFFPNIMGRIIPKPGKWMIILKKIFAAPILLTCIWLIWILYSQTQPQNIEKADNGIVWKVYNHEEIEKLLENGEPVFIDFTAKWCVTCLINKKIALSSDTFANIINSKKIHAYRADWTNHSEEIEKALGMYERNSIPLYIYYPKESNAYITLPQILTSGNIKDYIKE
ncbi:MAG: thioredoxin family protein [Lactobacillaceae bacterium]|nr:thioredoxin family protein [Lactobacillaceae bacterium]